jgi:hypothetical protein
MKMTPEEKIELYAAIMLPVFISRRGDCALGIVYQRAEDMADYAKAMANLLLSKKERLKGVPSPEGIEARALAAWKARERVVAPKAD